MVCGEDLVHSVHNFREWTAGPGVLGAKRHGGSYAPSWSWASVVSPIEAFEFLTYYDTLNGEKLQVCTAELWGVVVDKTTADPLGPGRGVAMLRGSVAVGRVRGSTVQVEGRGRITATINCVSLVLFPML